jgi:hypothetical protein
MCDVRRQQAYSFYTNTKRCTQQELKYKIFFLGVHFYISNVWVHSVVCVQ